jgi:hypothetical protein
LVSLGIIEAISKYPAQDSSSSNNLIQSSNEGDMSNFPRHIYFPLVLSTKKPSYSFINITRPLKFLTFIPVDVLLPNVMLFESANIIFEKYIYNMTGHSIHKLFYLEADSEDEVSPMIKASVINPTYILMHFTSLLQSLSSLKF